MTENTNWAMVVETKNKNIVFNAILNTKYMDFPTSVQDDMDMGVTVFMWIDRLCYDSFITIIESFNIEYNISEHSIWDADMYGSDDNIPRVEIRKEFDTSNFNLEEVITEPVMIEINKEEL